MPSLSRRRFLQVAAMSLGGMMLGEHSVDAQPGAPTDSGMRTYHGPNLADWDVIVGDATSACQPHVQSSDIETAHFPERSEVRANIFARKELMAHNITFKSVADPHVLDFVHSCTYTFRLPYLPSTNNTDFNGQTIEGQIALWDGQTSQRLHSVAYQWMVNPYWMFGTLQCWTADGWQPVGSLPVNTEWHTVSMMIDARRETTRLQIDTTEYHSSFVKELKPGFGSDVSAVVTAEAMSIDPGTQCTGGMPHAVQVKDWTWTWESVNASHTFLPLVSR